MRGLRIDGSLFRKIAARILRQQHSETVMSSDRLANHILPNSATMIGVCVTAVGLVKIAEDRIGPSNVDIYFAMAAILFLGSAVLSYLSVRAGSVGRASAILERMADVLFMTGLLAMTGIATLFAYEVI